MTTRRPKVRDVLIAAGVIFGRGRSIQDIALRVDAYTKIVELDRELGAAIDEFDLIRALEEIDSFLPTGALRKLANDLGILERYGDGLMRVRPAIFLDDVLPGDTPSDIAPIPIDFVQTLGTEVDLTAQPVSIVSTIERLLCAAPKVLEAAQASPIEFVTPFYRPEQIGPEMTLHYEGTPAAATPFLDLYLTIQDCAAATNISSAQETFADLLVRADEFVTAYLVRLVDEDDRVNAGAFRLEDDDDMPGATLPTTVANASLLSVLAGIARHKAINSTVGNTAAMAKLSDFILNMQNKDGGWPVYRFPPSTNRGKGPQSPSIALVGLVCFASLLDFSDHANDTQRAKIEAATRRYAKWLARSAHVLDEGKVAWDNGDDTPCVYETAINILSCLIVPILIDESRVEMDELVKSAIRFIDANWIVHGNAGENVHRIALRAPEADGPAPLPIHWMSPGHARVLRALSIAYVKRGFFPGFSSAAQMQKAANIISQDCADGLARRLNDPSVVEVSTTMHYLGALSAYHAAAEKWRSASDSS
jgi:hypothetical protein